MKFLLWIFELLIKWCWWEVYSVDLYFDGVNFVYWYVNICELEVVGVIFVEFLFGSL